MRLSVPDPPRHGSLPGGLTMIRSCSIREFHKLARPPFPRLAFSIASRLA
jgi:hypothetical protein